MSAAGEARGRDEASTGRDAGDGASTSAAATTDLEDASDGAAAADRRLAATIARQQARRERAAREPRASLWRHVARVGTLGWIVALPLAAGAVLGRLIDRRLESGVTWTLALILIGAVVAGASLWKMLAEEVER